MLGRHGFVAVRQSGRLWGKMRDGRFLFYGCCVIESPPRRGTLTATAREGSSDDMQRAPRRAVSEARRIADAMIARYRRAIPD